MASIAEVAVLLLNRSLLAGDFEGFVEGVGGPTGAGDLVHFEALQRFAVHHAVNGFGEVVLMVLGNRGERVPNDIDGLDVAVLDGQMDVDGILAYRAVLAVDRVVAVLVVAGVLLVGRGGGRVVVRRAGIGAVGAIGAVRLGLRLLFLRLLGLARVAGVRIVHRRGLGFAASGQQRASHDQSGRRQCRGFLQRTLFGHIHAP